MEQLVETTGGELAGGEQQEVHRWKLQVEEVQVVLLVVALVVQGGSSGGSSGGDSTAPTILSIVPASK